MKIIGLDVGEKRIGVARADSKTRIAVPVGFVLVDGSEWRRIARIANLAGTNLFVLGLPRSNEGNETAQSAYVREFARRLKQEIPEAKVCFQDESLTSVLAENRLKSRKRNYERGEIDTEAATIILQDFLERLPLLKQEQGEKGDFLAKTGGNSKNSTKNPATLSKNTGKAGMKKLKKLTILAVSIVVIGVIVAVGALLVREYRAKKRAEEYARQEAEMQAESFRFTIRPGETIFDIKNSLIEAGYSAEEATEALAADYNFSFLKERPAGATLEGFLYGETHEFYKGVPAKEIIETFLEGMEKVIRDNNLEAAYANRGLSLFEGVTLASVVQKEAGETAQPTVAQIFLSRLDNNIMLGSDVTVSYALDKVDPERTIYGDNGDALAIDSCYNTRLYRGLPCGPISNPGLSALLAVANPSDTSYLYFLTGDDGLMYYSYTEDEHNQNISEHCQSLCNVSL